MTPRLPWATIAPEAYEAMRTLEAYAARNLDPELHELVKLRASCLNGCAFCIDMHTGTALRQGQSVQRLALLPAWREAAHLYTERERAALALTDAITRLDGHGVSDEVWEAAAAQVDDKELVDLTTAIATINAWNRCGVTMRPAVEPRP